MRWEHAWATWRSDLIGLVLAFNFSPNSAGSMHAHEKLPSDSVVGSSSKFLRPSSQLLQCPDGPCCESNLRFSFTLPWLQFWLAWNNHREVFPEMNSEFQFLIPKLSTISGQFLWVKIWLKIISHVFGNQFQLWLVAIGTPCKVIQRKSGCDEERNKKNYSCD